MTQGSPEGKPYWIERGWIEEIQSDGRKFYTGQYHVNDRGGSEHTFNGQVILLTPGFSTQLPGFEKDPDWEARVLVIDPPEQIRFHPHGRNCMRMVQRLDDGSALFDLHFLRTPRDVDTAILYMERILGESLREEFK